MDCGARFTTYERIAANPLIIIKSDGSSEAYDRSKLFRGLLISCAKRPVSSDQLSALIDDIEIELQSGKNTLTSKELGDMALERLRDLDSVAYIRFASVYKDFQTLEEFKEALGDL